MTLIDATLPMDEALPAYPGDPPFSRWRYRSLDNAPYEATLLTFGSHMGTHIDAPRHFIPGGEDVASVSLDALCGPARVVDLRAADREITARVLDGLGLASVERLLLRTIRTDDLATALVHDCSFLTPDAANYLRERTSVRAVGIDTLSIESNGAPDFPVHHMLLGGVTPILILEGLDLRQAPPADYDLMCLPLRLVGVEASPVRAILKTR